MTDADLGADPEADLIARRARLMGPNVPTFYRAKTARGATTALRGPVETEE
ncbi:MAG: hypothetical protein ACO3WM_12165 [Gemmobacter sp.]